MNKRILLVDDEPAITRIAKLNLERTGNYTVETENHGNRAIAAAKAFKPDLILLDVMMPDMGGDEVSAQLKEDPELSHIKIVFMTAIVTHEETESMGQEIGGQTYLAKPASTEQMVDTIEKVLAQD